MKQPIIALLTDFGTADGYVGVMKGVMLDTEPHAQMVDITHEIAPQDVPAGAWILANSYRYFPKGTVFLCVVDPGVGSVRHPIAVHLGDWYFVGPDNGLFSYILAQQPIHQAVVLENPAYRLTQVSSTFHGRDIFAPAAAALACGVALTELGPTLAPEALQRLQFVEPVRAGAEIEGSVVHIDHFGNIITNIPLTMVPELDGDRSAQLTFTEHDVRVTGYRPTFAAPQAGGAAHPFIYGDSSGFVAVAIQNGNAAATLGIQRGASLKLTLSR
ncbi:hypothetical protein EI42_00725 [Thermosporothrix hazakensis]|jgi:S-adenosylmethionine hydrolase|uniref:S-adenosyl-l-methionine hydroxide adenosyltransferase n=2 Tax=Thermosporothrix TaxID=768650 RepID=A0A326URG9_THEHA|nr:SAM-dependent chlorinase/fluorinase [Thermosporothrix hazakensis]PZW36549.1 hypothetical protein EI42_00725 [Thermosporothrix hazakensis]BBH89015.1 hypothetical protein KTC_37660 [Thermosporothrix sp. COM3]GCE47199.1 hypothetical protein KTH_20680 [Thermosporothrix hazakensis]